MIAWPGTLPQRPLEEAFDEALPYQGDRSSVGELPLVQRQTTQAAVRSVTLTIQVTSDQLDLFQTFYRETLGFGALRFTWVQLSPIWLYSSFSWFRPSACPSSWMLVPTNGRSDPV